MSALAIAERVTDSKTTRATLSVNETASLLGISRSGLYELCRRNEAPGMIRLGKRIVFSRAAIMRLLNG